MRPYLLNLFQCQYRLVRFLWVAQAMRSCIDRLSSMLGSKTRAWVSMACGNELGACVIDYVPALGSDMMLDLLYIEDALTYYVRLGHRVMVYLLPEEGEGVRPGWWRLQDNGYVPLSVSVGELLALDQWALPERWRGVLMIGQPSSVEKMKTIVGHILYGKRLWDGVALVADCSLSDDDIEAVYQHVAPKALWAGAVTGRGVLVKAPHHECGTPTCATSCNWV